MTHWGRTSQKRASFSRIPGSRGSSHRAMMTSGMMPRLRSSRTECWAGLVLCSPEQEVFVTQDGAETDLDLGHYERFIDEDLNRFSNLTSVTCLSIESSFSCFPGG